MNAEKAPIRVGDATAVLDLIPDGVLESAPPEERLLLAAFRMGNPLGFRERREAVSSIVERVTNAIHATQPRTILIVFEGTNDNKRRRVDRVARTVTRKLSTTATNTVGADTTVIGLVIMSPTERDLAATCIRHVATDPPERGDGLVFHAAALEYANIYQLIDEAIT